MKLKDWDSCLEKRCLHLVKDTDIDKNTDKKASKVIVWLTGNIRKDDNWALICGAKKAKEENSVMEIVFSIRPDFLGATWRQFHFLLSGIMEFSEDMKKIGINTVILLGDPTKEVFRYIEKQKEQGLNTHLIMDFSAIRILREWKDTVVEKIKSSNLLNLSTSITLVDTTNIIPLWISSLKSEFAARTFRPKIAKLLPDFLTEFPKLEDLYVCKDNSDIKDIEWNNIFEYVKNNVDSNLEPSTFFIPGEKSAKNVLKDFLENKIQKYDEFRNDPMQNMQSNLSPYIHFGNISTQRIVLETMKVYKKSVWQDLSQTFYDEIIVRRELSQNFCYYNKNNYDNIESAPQWARETLKQHEKDERDYIYSLEDFETTKTHDPIWNACQREMINTGKMHGYMRMYWTKKILEWTKTPDDAVKIAIYLNDKYELDGRDPNGYVGVLWSIAGLHDRAWFPRKIFGTVRYMAESGLRKKFDVDAYMLKWGNK